MALTGAYYNENDREAAAWLRELIREGLIPDGEIDERDIREVPPAEIYGFRQHHFFAGIGGWAYALRLAGWPDDRAVVTGSCPCQPFSSAGKRKGTEDERHLWPAFRWLIAQLRPPVCFGEQVASNDGLEWLAGVSADLEALGYSVGAADLPAACVGSPHKRQRLFWVAGSETAERGRDGGTRCARSGRLGNAGSAGREERIGERGIQSGAERSPEGQAAELSGYWSDYELVGFTNGKIRRVEPASQRLANGISLAMEIMCNESQVEEEITNATKAIGFGDEIMRAVREGNDPQTIWQEIGRCVGIPESTLLLSVVCQHQGELGKIFNGKTSRREQDRPENMQSVRPGAPQNACASQGWGFPEQHGKQLRNALSKLSQDCPQYRLVKKSVAAFTDSPLATDVLGRVGLLRGYGNAIVPQVAAAFIRAYLEAMERSK